jgi:hypothetical protein
MSFLRGDLSRNCASFDKCIQAGPTGALAEKGFAVHGMVNQSDAVIRPASQPGKAHQREFPTGLPAIK